MWELENLKKPFMPPREVHVQVTHSMPPQKIEIFKSLENWAEENILIHLKPDPRTENSPYLGFIYTSFQERATFISHGNTARLAKEHGDIKLAQICGTIASDEKRHETAYTKIVEKLFEIDPDGTVMAFADMMRKKISMPAHLMYDGLMTIFLTNFQLLHSGLGSTLQRTMQIYWSSWWADGRWIS
ncbi:hypothetical protein GH714_012338 [Hevea brasiliensis]|uniref:Stearoyl-[acyl-carrier-protein] 9-desaturase n=1 Tax=Hevea brasiliensis TaxID=3981 RepID=A0A6A6LJZ5_HEVBR|nr:hypothetical protein GH714_012338 [Hevea brasiliensis]